MYNKEGGSEGMLPQENLNFQNLTNAIFWHSGTDVFVITDAVTNKLKGNIFGDPPSHTIFSGYPQILPAPPPTS